MTRNDRALAVGWLCVAGICAIAAAYSLDSPFVFVLAVVLTGWSVLAAVTVRRDSKNGSVR